MKTENLTINEAIDALNAGHKLTHPCLKKSGKYIIKDPLYNRPLYIDYHKGCNPHFPHGDTYHMKCIAGLKILTHDDELDICGMTVQWKNDEPEKNFEEYETGWCVIND